MPYSLNHSIKEDYPQKMRILQVNPYPPDHLGGSEIFCKNLSMKLKERHDIDSEILTSDIFNKKIKYETIANDIKVSYKKHYHNLWGKNPLVFILDYLLKNYRKYDIIHMHSYIFFTSLQCALFHKFRKMPLVLHIHGGVQTPNYLSTNFSEKVQLFFKNSIFDNLLGRFTIKEADKVISVSKNDLEFIEKQYALKKDKCNYIPNGVNLDKFQEKKALSRKYITFIGRLSYIKGFDRFLTLMKLIHKEEKEIEFLVVGDGPLKPDLRAVQEELPVKHYTSYPYEKIEDIYNLSKLMVIPSRFEGLPTSILEAFACKTPITATVVGGINEVLRDKKNGLILDSKNMDKNCNIIINLYRDKARREKYGENGRALVEKQFSLDIISDQIAEIYRELI